MFFDIKCLKEIEVLLFRHTQVIHSFFYQSNVSFLGECRTQSWKQTNYMIHPLH